MATKRTEANQKWQNKNKERSKYLRYRSSARVFIKELSSYDDLEELKRLIAERENTTKS
ncbi:hypothetical protein [Fructilactobacillus florum]|uniref:hypothetical protein n=1 Tax=Fructilactobacillus florum TaxID=640331 RepID=UPI000AD1A02A|nr:hypothetical protein [Fructilactobacillus florum]